jgi:hypothetical protein
MIDHDGKKCLRMAYILNSVQTDYPLGPHVFMPRRHTPQSMGGDFIFLRQMAVCSPSPPARGVVDANK